MNNHQWMVDKDSFDDNKLGNYFKIIGYSYSKKN